MNCKNYFPFLVVLIFFSKILPAQKANYPLMYKENVIQGSIIPIQAISMNGKNPELIPNISYPKIDILLKKIFKKKQKIYFLDIGAQFIDNYLFLSKKNKNLEYIYFDQKINNKIVDKFSKNKKLKRFKSLIKIQDIKNENKKSTLEKLKSLLD